MVMRFLRCLALTLPLLACTGYVPATADPVVGLVQLTMPTLACDKLPQLQSLVATRQKSWDDFKAAFLAMQSKLDRFKEPPCMYTQLGVIMVSDKKGDIIDLGEQKPDQADHADHVWLVHAKNSVTDMWVLWAERIVVETPSACDITKAGCI